MFIALLVAAAVTNPPQISFSQDSSQAARRSLANKFSDTVSVKDAPWLAVGDGSANDATAINAALTAHNGVVSVPASTSCYNIGTTTITIPSGRTLQGEGYGSPGSGAACITYSGSGCAVLFESVRNAGLRNLDIQVSSASSTAAGVCFKSGTSNAEFNSVENVSITNAGTARTSGQIGLWLEDTSAGIFWNHFRMLRFKSWDVSVYLHATGTTQGVNANRFYDLMSYSHNTAYRLRAGNKQVTDNHFYSVTCSRSDGTLVGATQCMMMGDDNVSGVFGNTVIGLDNDSGTPDTCGVLGTTAGANYVDATCDSGGGFQDNGVGTFPNIVVNHLGLGSTLGLMSVGNLITKLGAQIVGTSWFGPVGNGAAGAGAIIQFHGSDANAASQPGGGWQITSGNGGSGNSSPGDILVSPGVRQGTGQGGTVVLGPSAGQGPSGLLIRSGRIVDAEKPFLALDCAGAGISVSVSNLLDRGLFTCGTAQNVTMPTAAGASGIVQGLPGNGTSTLLGGPLLVGAQFHFWIVSTAAATVTLVAGAGVTFPAGSITVNNTSRQVLCVVTSVTASSETISCY